MACPHRNLLYDYNQQCNSARLDMKNIKIISCNDSSKWYASLVGQVIPLLEEEEQEYKSREPSGFINFVSKVDAELTEEVSIYAI